MRCIAIQYAIHCDALRCNMQCITIQIIQYKRCIAIDTICDTSRYIAIQYAMHCDTSRYIRIHFETICDALRYNMRFIAMHCDTSRYIRIHFETICDALRYNMRFIAMHTIGLQCRKILHCNYQFFFVVDHRVHVESHEFRMMYVSSSGFLRAGWACVWWGHYPALITEQLIREFIAPAISLRVEHSSRDAIFHHRSCKNLAQITIAAAMIALATGVYIGH